MYRGDFIGLCELLRSTAYPPLHAAQVAVWLLEQTRPIARMYGRHLSLMRELALSKGEPVETVELFEDELRQPLMRGRLLESIDFEVLLSPEAWDERGPSLIPISVDVKVVVASTCHLCRYRQSDGLRGRAGRPSHRQQPIRTPVHPGRFSCR